MQVCRFVRHELRYDSGQPKFKENLNCDDTSESVVKPLIHTRKECGNEENGTNASERLDNTRSRGIGDSFVNAYFLEQGFYQKKHFTETIPRHFLNNFGCRLSVKTRR